CVSSSADHHALHSFPTRRSSDLLLVPGPGRLARVLAPPTRPLGDHLVLPGLGWAAGPAARGGTPGSLRSGGRVQHLASHGGRDRSEEHTSELQSRENLVCRLLLE